MAAPVSESNTIKCVIGKPIEDDHRAEGEPVAYVYIQGHVALYSPNRVIPAEPFLKMAQHYASHNHTPDHIAALQKLCRIRQIIRFADISEIFPGQKGEE